MCQRPSERYCRRRRALARSGKSRAGSRASRSSYGWFTEGFETFHFNEAKTLLAGLDVP